MPSLQTDGVAFFPNVLKTKDFQEHGILFGDEAAPETTGTVGLKKRLRWAVVDPRKHVLYIWEKTTPEFPDSAVALGASVFTDGPFGLYSGQKTGFSARLDYYWDRAKLYFALGVLYVLVQTVPFLDQLNYGKIHDDAIRQLLKKHFGDTTPEGYIFGQRGSIKRTDLSRKNHHYFGRKTGREFADYLIGKGDPDPAELKEVIGGLFRTVDNYTDALDDPRADASGVRQTHQSNDFGYWGLAPLAPSDTSLTPGDIEGALESLSAYDKQHTPALPPCIGVVIVVFYGGDTSVMAAKLIGVRVRDTVRIDGSDSVLFGHDKDILVGAGDDMPDRKKYYNKWGYMTLPG